MKKIDILVLLFFLFASLFTLKDLFLPGFYTSHDGPHQIVRAYYYHQDLLEGQIPPRWAGGLNHGFGYPLFIFSYHLPWLMAEPFQLIGLPVIDSVKMTFLAGFILSGVTMYFYLKNSFGRLPAFTGSVIYLFAPFRFSNIFVRAAIGDATAFIIAPLLFWSLDLLRKEVTLPRIIFLSFSLTLLLLSHAMVFFFYMLALLCYILFTFIFNKNRFKFLFSCLLSFILFIFYSSFYLLPSVFERSYTRFSQIMSATFNSRSFLTLPKLIYSPWGYGTVDAPEGAMSLSIGLAQLAVVLMAFLLIVYSLFRKDFKKIFYIHLVIFFILFLMSVFITLPLSRPFWQFVSRYILIDFSWRSLNLSVFAVSVLAASLFYHLKNIKPGFIPLLAFLLLILAFYANRNHTGINQSLDWTLPFFLKLEKTTNSYDEYNPQWVNPQIISENAPPFTFSADFSFKLLENKSHLRKLEVNTSTDGVFTTNTLYYPGWTVYDNGRRINIDYQSRGLIEFPLKKGSHRLEIVFQKTRLRQLSDLLTFSTIILTAIYLSYRMISPRMVSKQRL